MKKTLLALVFFLVFIHPSPVFADNNCFNDPNINKGNVTFFVKRLDDGIYVMNLTFPTWYMNTSTGRYRALWSLFERKSYDKGLTWTCAKLVSTPPDINTNIVEGLVDPGLSTMNKFMAVGRFNLHKDWQVTDYNAEISPTDAVGGSYGDSFIIYPFFNSYLTPGNDWSFPWEYPLIGFDPVNQKQIDYFNQIGAKTDRKYDVVYSTWTIPINGVTGETNLYFHGWQGELSNSDKLPTCNIVDWPNYIDKYDYCNCSSPGKTPLSSCTLDKIFYARNSNSSNNLEFHVFSGNALDKNDNRLDGSQWLSETWSAILTAKTARAICEKPYCDYLGIGGIGDPSIVKLPSGKYVMYFNMSQHGNLVSTDTAGSRSGIFVVTSDDPIHFAATTNQVKPLRKKDGTYWYDPAKVRVANTSVPDNILGYVLSSNSAFSATYEPSLNKIIIIAQTTELPESSGENGKVYRMIINPDDPYYAESVNEINIANLATASISGDLDHNGKVDIFDYNTMLQNFGKTNCGNVADIDGNCKVDIFDYNISVGNFGRT